MTENVDAAKHSRRFDVALVAIVILLLIYGGWFIYQTAGVAEGQTYFSLFDDQMISMTYARNFVEGKGLRWNQNLPPVEGFTNPLWTFLFVLVHIVVPSEAYTSLAVMIVGLLLLAANLFVIHELIRRHFLPGTRGSTIPAVLLTAGYYHLIFWTLRGFETGAQTLIISFIVLLLFDEIRLEKDRSIPLFIILLLAVLLRNDMMVFVLPTVAIILFLRFRHKRPFAKFYTGLAIFLSGNLLYLVFRLLYFGDPLPNTYYLKLTGINPFILWQQGLNVLLNYHIAPHLLFFAVVVLFSLSKSRNSVLNRILLAFVALQFLLVIYVGGDAWEDRYMHDRWVAVVMPLLFVVFNDFLNEMRLAFEQRIEKLHPSLVNIAFGLMILLALLNINSLDVNVPERNEQNWKRYFVLDQPRYSPWEAVDIRRIKRLETFAPPDAKVAVNTAGISGYFSDFRLIDLLGYNDRHIARTKVDLRTDQWVTYRPGHVKRDYDYVFNKLKPDVIYEPKLNDVVEAEHIEEDGFIYKYGFTFRAMENLGSRAEFVAGNTDLTGDTDIPAPDGKRDKCIELTLENPGLITSIQVRGLRWKEKTFATYDTIIGNTIPGLAVTNGKELESAKGEVRIDVKKGLTLKLWFPRSAYRRQAYYDVIIYYLDKGFLVLPVDSEYGKEGEDISGEAFRYHPDKIRPW